MLGLPDIPRQARRLEQRLVQLVGTVVAIGDDLSALRQSLEPVGDRTATMQRELSGLRREVRGLRTDITRVNAQLDELLVAVPDLKPDGLLSRARDAVAAD